MDVREKLVELIAQKVCDTWSESCDEWLLHDCGKCYANDCLISEIADHLISNGVTVQALDGCEYCEEYEDLPEHFVSGKPVGRVFDTCIQTDEKGWWHIEVPSGADIGIKFCPMCGRKLPQPPKGE